MLWALESYLAEVMRAGRNAISPTDPNHGRRRSKPQTLCRVPSPPQMLKEYVGKVDMLMSERKEQQKEKEQAQQAQRHQEAQRNAYATLMPLALPAPNMTGPGGPGGGYGDHHGAAGAGGFGAAPHGGFGGAPQGFGGHPFGGQY